MLLIDLSQIMFSSVLSSKEPLDEGLIRHLVINAIRSHVKKFKQYNSVVLCVDSKTYWRKTVFPHYKAQRKQYREKSKHDWSMIFDCFNKIKSELKENFPYKFLEVDSAEADDVIAVLTKKYSIHEPIMIVSSDADFKQLHKYQNVKQYNPILGVFVTSKRPEIELKEKIIRGDKGDGIPSILSSDDTFVIGKRQSPITAKKIDIWINQDPKTFCESEEIYRNYTRNDLLINLENIPRDIQDRVTNIFDEISPAPRQKLYKYLVANRLINLIESIEDF